MLSGLVKTPLRMGAHSEEVGDDSTTPLIIVQPEIDFYPNYQTYPVML